MSEARRKTLTLVLCCAAQFMVILDVSIVNVALPSIRNDLHFSATNLQWVVNAYTLTFAGFLLLGGVLTQLLAWQWILFVNVPIGVVAAYAALRLVHDVERDPTAPRHYDAAGAVTVTAGLVVLVYGIVRTDVNGWGSSKTLIAM